MALELHFRLTEIDRNASLVPVYADSCRASGFIELSFFLEGAKLINLNTIMPERLPPTDVVIFSSCIRECNNLLIHEESLKSYTLLVTNRNRYQHCMIPGSPKRLLVLALAE